MNATPSRRGWLVACVATGLFVGNVLAFLELHASQASAEAAADNLAECRRIADDIGKLRLQPPKVTIEAHSVSQLSKRMEEALKFAQVPTTCLVRVDPQPARRLSDTEFKEQSTSLDLRNVSLKQLIQFLHKLESGGDGLQTRSLQLAAAPKASGDSTGETWTAQVVLTNLIFAPKKTPPP